MQIQFTLIFTRAGSWGNAFVFPPLQPVHSPPGSRMLGDTAVSLLQCTEPVPATRQPSTLLSPPSRARTPRALLHGGGCRCFQAFSTPNLRYVFPCTDTLIPLSTSSRMGAFTRSIAVGSPHNPNRLHSSVWEKSPPFRGVHLTVSNQRRQGFCSTTGTFLPSLRKEQ